MENELITKLEERKKLILIFIIITCVIINGYSIFILVKEIVYTHFFYIPIILAVAYVIGYVSEKRDNAEKKIIIERDRSQKILSAIGEVVYILDPGLNITEVNRTHLKMFNVKIEEVIGMKCYELFFNGKEVRRG
jgi:PAS domain-containing protein